MNIVQNYDNDGYHSEVSLTVEPLDNLVVLSIDEYRNHYPIGLTSIPLNQNELKELICTLQKLLK